MKKFSFLCFGLASILSSCASLQNTISVEKDRLVAVSDVTKSIKCALATALADEKNHKYKRLEGRVAALEYHFKIVDTTKADASITAEKNGPFIFTLSGGTASILPTLGGSVQQTNTVETTIVSRIGLTGNDTSVCGTMSGGPNAAPAFTDWLANVIQQLDVAAGYSPKGVVDSIVFETDFAVTKSGHGGVTPNFIFFSGSANVSQERNDIQQIKMTLRARNAEEKKNPPGSGDDGDTLGPMEVPPKLKTD